MATDGRRVMVTGATGAQGGSVARFLLESGRYQVRALTRNADSEKAQALKAAGAEVVEGDLDDPATLGPALAGCNAVFGVTSLWEHFGKELQHGRNLIDAVAESGVDHFVFSTLPSVTKISGGELEAPHFDIKADMEDYARQRNLPATFVHVAFYYENFLAFFLPHKEEDGSFSFGFPQGETPLAGIAAEDLGGVLLPVFDRPEEYRGRTITALGDYIPATEYAAAMSRATGKRIVFNHIPRETFASFGFPGADDLANMFDFYRRFVTDRTSELAECRRLYPALQIFETWMTANKEKLGAVLV